ncbi:hypothetical protein DFJ74DRAFT_716388 [Hyaloraphidium curvatum]|nr:hypothetical protein DFJ74DRAFT_716388 [Hyaloraphidium curvatum]
MGRVGRATEGHGACCRLPMASKPTGNAGSQYTSLQGRIAPVLLELVGLLRSTRCPHPDLAHILAPYATSSTRLPSLRADLLPVLELVGCLSGGCVDRGAVANPDRCRKSVYIHRHTAIDCICSRTVRIRSRPFESDLRSGGGLSRPSGPAPHAKTPSGEEETDRAKFAARCVSATIPRASLPSRLDGLPAERRTAALTPGRRTHSPSRGPLRARDLRGVRSCRSRQQLPHLFILSSLFDDAKAAVARAALLAMGDD